jgi:hypothetical protein
MTTEQVAKRLVELCRKGDYEKAQKELYDESAVSIESEATPAFPKETKGLKAIIEKGHKFESMVEKVHSSTVTDPLVAEHAIAFEMETDMTMKERGRTKMKELCVYKVNKDGKIISEHFFN